METYQLTCNGAREPAQTSMLTRHPVPEPAVTQKRWCVTEALVKEHGRTMGCPSCSSGIGRHMAECRGRIEEILLQQSRMKPTEEDESRGDRTTTKSVPMELEKPTRPALQHGGSSESGAQLFVPPITCLVLSIHIFLRSLRTTNCSASSPSIPTKYNPPEENNCNVGTNTTEKHLLVLRLAR